MKRLLTPMLVAGMGSRNFPEVSWVGLVPVLSTAAQGYRKATGWEGVFGEREGS